jgi:hypothetical protein
MVIEDFTYYNVFDNKSSNLADVVMYHRMQESPNPNLNPNLPRGDSVDRKELFFYGAYNPRISYVSNRSYEVEGINVNTVMNNKNTAGYLPTFIRKFFCCG